MYEYIERNIGLSLHGSSREASQLSATIRDHKTTYRRKPISATMRRMREIYLSSLQQSRPSENKDVTRSYSAGVTLAKVYKSMRSRIRGIASY